MTFVDDYGGVAHPSGCVYCRGRWPQASREPWDWFAGHYYADKERARFQWSREVREAARVLTIPVHPVLHTGQFVSRRTATNSEYVALPYCAEEALRHCQYEPGALDRLFRRLNDSSVRKGAYAAFQLGGSFALRDYLRAEGAL